MPGKRRTHSKQAWANLPPTVIRCNGSYANGEQCRREAEGGSVVCDKHGGAAPQVRRRAAERIMTAADEAIQVMTSMISDPTIPAGVRLKAAQNLADRAGLGAAQVVKVIPDTQRDPVEALFADILDNPSEFFADQTLALPAGQPADDDLASVADDLNGDGDAGADVVHMGVVTDDEPVHPAQGMPAWLVRDFERANDRH